MGKVEKITKKPEAKTQASPITDAQMAAAADISSFSPQERQYMDITEYMNLTEKLREKLKSKNPATYDEFVKGYVSRLVPTKGGGMAESDYAVDRPLEKIVSEGRDIKLTDDEVKEALKNAKASGGKSAYDRFNELKRKYYSKTYSGLGSRSEEEMKGYGLRDAMVRYSYMNAGDKYGNQYFEPMLKDGNVLYRRERYGQFQPVRQMAAAQTQAASAQQTNPATGNKIQIMNRL